MLQRGHVDDLAEELVPSGQIAHSCLFDWDVVPAGQVKHWLSFLTPVTLFRVPSGHILQAPSLPTFSLYWPMGQGVHPCVTPA